MENGNNLVVLKNLGILNLFIFLLLFISVSFVSQYILEWMLEYYEVFFVSLTVTETFSTQMFTSFVLSFVLSISFFIYSIYYFVRPALKKKLNILFYITTSQILAIEGLILGSTYFSKLIITTLDSSTITFSMYSLKDSILFSLGIGASFALFFQLIIFLPLLQSLSLINYKKLFKYTPLILLIGYIISAFITPPDLLSTGVVLFPLSFSFFTGLLLCRVREGKKI